VIKAVAITMNHCGLVAEAQRHCTHSPGEKPVASFKMPPLLCALQKVGLGVLIAFFTHKEHKEPHA